MEDAGPNSPLVAVTNLREFFHDSVQKALLAAAMQWPDEGVPDNPRAWLIQVAARRMTD